MTRTEGLQLVTRAVRATLEGDSSVVGELFTHDVQASMTTRTWSAPGLAVEIEDRAGVFADVDLRITRSCGTDDELWAEWTASVLHVGPLAIGPATVPPTGRRTELCGVTVARLTSGRISRFRQHWDWAALLDHPLHHPGGESTTPLRGR